MFNVTRSCFVPFWFLPAVIGCDAGDDLTFANTPTPVSFSGEVLESALMIEESDTACPEAREIKLVQRDGKLRMNACPVQNPTCGGAPTDTDCKAFTVFDETVTKGQKTYAANSPSGALWLYTDSDRWLAELYSYTRPIWPHTDSLQVFRGTAHPTPRIFAR